MPISKIFIENFKGFKAETEVVLKPITLVIGTNSSGKSSLIHSLAALAQTARVLGDSRPLVLDDESAYVHLGRFIEVIHSRSYQDCITLGVEVNPARYLSFSEAGKAQYESGIAFSKMGFKCSKRTQEISIERAIYGIGPHEYEVTKSGSKYYLKSKQASAPLSVNRKGGFLFDSLMSSRAKGQRLVEGNFPFEGLQAEVSKELKNIRYLGPFRQAPARRYASRGANPTEVGAMGEGAVTMLANEVVQSRSRPHAKQIKSWLQTLGLAKSVDVARIGTSDLFDVALELDDGKKFPLADLGYGLSQVLPVLVQCSFAPKNATLLFEQPEIHLHNLSARGLATVFRETMHQKGTHILAETHSPELVKQFFQDIKNGHLKRTDFALYRVSRSDGRSILKEIEVEGDGGIYENWESGISIE